MKYQEHKGLCCLLALLVSCGDVADPDIITATILRLPAIKIVDSEDSSIKTKWTKQPKTTSKATTFTVLSSM